MKIKEMFSHRVEIKYWDEYTDEWVEEEFSIVKDDAVLQKQEAKEIIAKGTCVKFFVLEISQEPPALVVLSEGDD